MTAPGEPAARGGVADLAMLAHALGSCRNLDEVITTALDRLAEIGFGHSLLMMLDETGERLFTIASHGYERPGIGSEVTVGVGVLGMVAAVRAPMRVLNLQRLVAYARSAADEEVSDGEREIPLPGLPRANSQLAVPAVVMGQVLGVLGVESERLGAFSAEDEALLTVVAHLLATAIELDRVGGRSLVTGDDEATATSSPLPRPTLSADHPTPRAERTTTVRFYPVDGSTFVDGDYLIKGVAGRILWRLLRDHVEEGRTDFTNREVRLDPSLELPPYRDNLESRLILLTRRLDERSAPMRIERTGRGRFRLLVDGALRLERSE